jgi:TetR/AcrR family transcriptional regulator of autoinduction and epiphytic fitness
MDASRGKKSKDRPKRRYDSSRRQAQARQTRLQILEAARLLFTTQGYNGATIEAIAQGAGVAVETVYATFGNKPAILSSLVDISVMGDDQPLTMLERPEIHQVKEQADPQVQLRMFAHLIGQIMSRMAPLFEVMNAAAKTEHDIAALLERLLQERLEGMADFVASLSATAPLRDGLDKQRAAETVWALTSAEVYNLLTGVRSWSNKQYETWLSETLERLLLPDQPD